MEEAGLRSAERLRYHSAGGVKQMVFGAREWHVLNHFPQPGDLAPSPFPKSWTEVIAQG